MKMFSALVCHVPAKTVTSNIICIYCGSVDHISGRCHNKPNDNREEPRSMPRDLRDQKPNKTYNRMSQPQVSHHQVNDTMFTPIKIFDGTNRLAFEDWIDKIKQACRASDRHFRTVIKKAFKLASNMEKQLQVSKGGPVKSSDARDFSQPSTSTQGETHRPQVICTACGGTDHLRKDCHEDVFCTSVSCPSKNSHK